MTDKYTHKINKMITNGIKMENKSFTFEVTFT